MATVTMLGAYLPTSTVYVANIAVNGTTGTVAGGIASVTIEAGSSQDFSTNAAFLAVSNLASTAWQNPASATNWTWTSDGAAVTLTGYTGPNDVVVPDMLDNLPVTGFGLTFSPDAEGSAITSVSGGENVTTIGGFAFNRCTSLTSVSLQNATTIEESAFDNCTALTSVYFGQNAPAEAEDVYYSTPSVTNYITSSTATGWGATWNGRPVVRLPLYADNFTAAGVGASPTGHVHAAGDVTNLQSTVAGYGYLTNVTPAAIVAAGGGTNLTVVQPYALNCSPTVSVTKAMINAAPWGEMSLSLTGVVQLFCIDTNSFAAGDVATWSTYFSGTNAITFCTNTITGTAWTNATATGSDRIFRKASGKNTVAIW
jgi:hypothetical protein